MLGVVLGFWLGYFTRSCAVFLLYFSTTSYNEPVSGSFSWRIPLGIQILPGILLGVGCLFLPPSPRSLVQKGNTSKALQSLNKLRFPKENDIDEDHPLLKLEFLEMQVEAAMHPPVHERGFMTEVGLWLQLFKPQYIRRTLVGVAVMFWQRKSSLLSLLLFS